MSTKAVVTLCAIMAVCVLFGAVNLPWWASFVVGLLIGGSGARLTEHYIWNRQ